jgi:hypothetical protein
MYTCTALWIYIPYYLRPLEAHYVSEHA